VVQLGILLDDAHTLLPSEDFLAQLVHPWSNLPLYLSAHSLGTWCGAWQAPGAKYMKERLVGHQRFLLPHQATALSVMSSVKWYPSRPSWRFHGCGALVDRGVPLVCLAAEESIEILEASSARRPLVEWTHRASLPDGISWHFPNWAVE